LRKQGLLTFYIEIFVNVWFIQQMRLSSKKIAFPDMVSSLANNSKSFIKQLPTAGKIDARINTRNFVVQLTAKESEPNEILHKCFHLSNHTLRLQAHSNFSLYLLSSPQAETSRCHFDHVLFPFKGTVAVSC